MSEKCPSNIILKQYSKWFSGSCWRNGVSFRRKTFTVQKSLETLKNTIQKFNAKLLREQIQGMFQLGEIANMDQMQLPFVLDDDRTHDTKGADEV